MLKHVICNNLKQNVIEEESKLSNLTADSFVPNSRHLGSADDVS